MACGNSRKCVVILVISAKKIICVATSLCVGKSNHISGSFSSLARDKYGLCGSTGSYQPYVPGRCTIYFIYILHFFYDNTIIIFFLLC